MAMVVIDPGHGGTKVVGKSSPNNAVGPNGTLEKTLTLALGLKVKDLLSQAGFSTGITRQTDVNVGLARRAHIARDLKADAYVSIHFNGWDGRVQGTETYVHSRSNDKSHKLAKCVQRQVVNVTGHNNRGVKRNGFGTLNPSDHHAGTAACLLEVSFLDVADEERRLQDPAYLDRIAQAIVDGVAEYLSAPAPMAVLPASTKHPAEPQDGYEAVVR